MLQEAGPSTSAEAVGKGRGMKWKEHPGVENITPTSLKIKLPKNTFNFLGGLSVGHVTPVVFSMLNTISHFEVP